MVISMQITSSPFFVCFFFKWNEYLNFPIEDFDEKLFSAFQKIHYGFSSYVKRIDNSVFRTVAGLLISLISSGLRGGDYIWFGLFLEDHHQEVGQRAADDGFMLVARTQVFYFAPVQVVGRLHTNSRSFI